MSELVTLYKDINGVYLEELPEGKFTLANKTKNYDTYQVYDYIQEIQDNLVPIPLGDFKSYHGSIIHITKPFYLSKYTVTQEQYIAVMGSLKGSNYAEQNLPVILDNSKLAKQFINRLNEITGLEYRLPSASEWEYCCRAVTSSTISPTKYCFGNDKELLIDYAWYSDNSEGKVHPVGQKKPNNFGLYDMHGNVWELSADNGRGPSGYIRTQAPYYTNSFGLDFVLGGSTLSSSEYCTSYTTWVALLKLIGIRLALDIK